MFGVQEADLPTIERIAREYYIDKLSQKEIANKLEPKRNQAFVSRVIRRADELGVVDHIIDASFAITGREHSGLARQLRDEFKLKTCLVLQVDEHDGDDYLHTAIANHTGLATKDSIAVGEHLAVGGGRAAYRVCEMIRRRPPSRRDVRISPLTGRLWAHQWQLHGPTLQRPIDADDCAFVLALAFEGEPGTRFSQISHPLYASTKGEARRIAKEHCAFLSYGKWRWSVPGRAVVGVGVIHPKSGHRMADVQKKDPMVEVEPYLGRTRQELAKMMSVVEHSHQTGNRLPWFGDVANRLFAALPLPNSISADHLPALSRAYKGLLPSINRLNDRSVVASWAHFRAVPSVLAVAGGKLKVEVLWTLALTGLLQPGRRIITDLSTDSDTAAALLTAIKEFKRLPDSVRSWYEHHTGIVLAA